MLPLFSSRLKSCGLICSKAELQLARSRLGSRTQFSNNFSQAECYSKFCIWHMSLQFADYLSIEACTKNDLTYTLFFAFSHVNCASCDCISVNAVHLTIAMPERDYNEVTASFQMIWSTSLSSGWQSLELAAGLQGRSLLLGLAASQCFHGVGLQWQI